MNTFVTSTITAVAGTPLVAFIPPFRGDGTMQYRASNAREWSRRTHLTQAVYTASATAHTLVVLRPLNWCTVTSAVTPGSAEVTLDRDPGAYSVAYRYGRSVASTPDNPIAAGDYVAVQLRDATWHVSAVASVSELVMTLTTAIPNITGGGIAPGAVVFFFGAPSDDNPQTGQAQVSFLTVANARALLLSETARGSVAGLNPGDPLLLYSGNETHAGRIDVATARYE